MSTFKDGRKVVTTAGTRVPLGSSEAILGVVVTALSTNTGVITVGGPTTVAAAGTRSGLALAASATSPFIPVDDLADVNIDATVSGEGVSYSYIAAA